MENILNNIYIAVVVILLFGAAIFVHEYGHYWVALRRKLKVEEFAIGFGPKLFSWRAKNGVLWSIRGIPAGGFVKLPQMVTSEAIEGKSEEELPPITPLSKILVSVAGPFMNVVFAFVIATVIYFIGLPVPANDPIVGRLKPDSEAVKAGFLEGDLITQVEGKAVKNWMDVHRLTALALTNRIALEVDRGGTKKVLHLDAKLSEVIGGKYLDLPSKEKPVVGSVDKEMPAGIAGILPGDKIISFAGVSVSSQEDLIDIVSKSEGRSSTAIIERAGQPMSFQLTPKYDPENKRGRIGVGFAIGTLKVQKPGPHPWDQITGVWDQMVRTIKALVFSSQSGVKAKDLSGPVGILSVLAIQANTDYRLALSFLVLLNINLAVLNMLPVPVLDGGHICMAILEKIRGKPLSVRLIEITTSAFAILLLSFMAYVTFFDVKRFPLFKAMFGAETRIEQATNAPAADKR